MQSDEVIKAGTIIVATKTQSTGCGVKYIKKGSILEVARDKPNYNNDVRVFRNAEAKEEDDYHYIDITEAIMATAKEIEMWNKGIYFI